MGNTQPKLSSPSEQILHAEPLPRAATLGGSNRVAQVVLYALVSVLIAAAVSSLSLRKGIDTIKGLSADRWIEDNTSWTFESFFPRGHYLEVELSVAARPANSQTVVIHATNTTGEKISAAISPENARLRLPIRSARETYRFHIENPFTPNTRDGRLLGAQVKTALVRSKFGIVLPDWHHFLGVWAALFGIVTVCAQFVQRKRSLSFALPLVVAAGVAPLIAAYFFGDGASITAIRAVPTGLILALLFLGVALNPRPAAAAALKLQARPASLLAGIVALGCALRVLNLNFGLPESFFHPDELVKAKVIADMQLNQTLHPHYFLHPTLLLYLTYGMKNVLDFFSVHADWHPLVRTVFAGRIISAAAGTLTIPLVYLIGKYLVDARTGLLAAAIFAVTPLHVDTSHFLKEDVLLLFSTLLCMVCALRAASLSSPAWLYASLFAAGVAAGSKYSGAVAVAFPLAVPWLVQKRSAISGTLNTVKQSMLRAFAADLIPSPRFLAHAALGLPLIVLGFFVCAPYAILDSAEFMKGFNSERQHMVSGHGVYISPWTYNWSYMVAYALVPGTTPGLVALGLIGLGALLAFPFRRNTQPEAAARWKWHLMIVAAFLLFYLPAEFARAKNSRYVVPCLPFFALAASYTVFKLIDWSRSRIVAALCMTAVLLVPLTKSLMQQIAAGTDTRDQMSAWMLANLPAGTKVIDPFQAYSPDLPSEHFVVQRLTPKDWFKVLPLAQAIRSGNDYIVMSSTFYERFLSPLNPGDRQRQIISHLMDDTPVVKVFSKPWANVSYHNPDVVLMSLREEDRVKRRAACRQDAASDDCTEQSKRSQFSLDYSERLGSIINWW